MQIASSLSTAEEGTVQFDSAVIYADDGESLPVNIMRLGGLHAESSVDYETEGSERWAHRYEALKGTVHFRPGERTKTIILRFSEHEYHGSAVEVNVSLTNPQGCKLGAYLKRVRVKLLDNDTFPTKFAEDIKRDYTAESWRAGKNVSMFIAVCKSLFMHTVRGSIKLIVAGQVNNMIFISELWIMRAIINALDSRSDDYHPDFLYITTLALCLVIPFGLTHLIMYQSRGWGVGGGARKFLREALMGNFLNFKEESRDTLNTYDWIAVFNVEVLTLVSDGFKNFFSLIAATGKVVFLALFMTGLAFLNYFETGESTLFISIVPFFLLPPIIGSYLAWRWRGSEEALNDLVDASIRLRSFTGECVSHYRTIADYWSRPIVLTQTMHLAQDFNKYWRVRNQRRANDEAFFGWLIKLLQLCTITGLCALVLRGQIKIGTFSAVLKGLTTAAKEFQGAYGIMIKMRSSLPCMWKCVRYMNMPNDLRERKDKLSELRRVFSDNIHTEELQNPGGIPEDRVPLSIENITFTYKGEPPHIFLGLSMTINQGEFVALLGPHNSGKSTLLQILCGLLLPSTGSSRVPPHLRVLHVRYEQPIWDRPLSDTLFYGWMAANGVTRVEDLDEHTITKGLDVCNQLRLDQGLVDMIEREARSRANPSIKGKEMLTDRTGLTTDSSYKLQLACALIAHPEVLVIHKPVAHATWKDGALMMEALRRYVDDRGILGHGKAYARRPRTCMVSMEKPVFLDKVHRALELHNGQVRELTANSLLHMPSSP
jgi:ABC-type multidrug transport system fused ATPase/permease subunit